ncbi:MAG TPA: mechanosensitive ion channel family protein [Candidatus Eremiobacteraceae bacterium]|nr:mechanosensitive ion channel family protein [Candidatus Eremiobacteraceae bacterium]
MFALLPPVNVDELAARAWDSLIAVAVTIVVWRLAIVAIDRLFARRFGGRFIPHAATFGAVLKSATAGIAFVAVVLALLHIWGADITPELWSAGIITASLAFGAQSVVRDVLAGLLFLFEDVYEIGDEVEITTTVNSIVTGTVETLSLRLTVIVDHSGRRYAIPNGNILMVANANKLAFDTSFTMTLPLRTSIDGLRTQMAELAKSAGAAAGINADAINVYVDDVGLDAATFRVDFPTARGDAAAMRSKIRESVVAKAQTNGWLPGGSAER